MITDAAPRSTRAVLSGVRAHRPLFVLAAAMAVLAVVAVLGLVIEDRTITGMPLWAKPLKFALSFGIYALTFGWLFGQLRRGRRVAWWAGTVAAVFAAVEMVIIVGQALRMTTSHYNVSTPFDETLWSVMGGSIVAIWVATLVISMLLFASPGPDRARNIAVRAGAVISLVGMALGFLMTIPSAEQISADSGIAGAHTVGLADGGPGLPLLGWSTVGGDLRIPHFVGMHALQLLPLFLIMVELLSRRFVVLTDGVVRARLMWVAICGYCALLALVTWQALRGQSIVAPDQLTLLALGVIVVAIAVPTALVLNGARSGAGGQLTKSSCAATGTGLTGRRCGDLGTPDRVRPVRGSMDIPGQPTTRHQRLDHQPDLAVDHLPVAGWPSRLLRGALDPPAAPAGNHGTSDG